MVDSCLEQTPGFQVFEVFCQDTNLDRKSDNSTRSICDTQCHAQAFVRNYRSGNCPNRSSLAQRAQQGPNRIHYPGSHHSTRHGGNREWVRRFEQILPCWWEYNRGIPHRRTIDFTIDLKSTVTRYNPFFKNRLCMEPRTSISMLLCVANFQDDTSMQVLSYYPWII